MTEFPNLPILFRNKLVFYPRSILPGFPAAGGAVVTV